MAKDKKKGEDAQAKGPLTWQGVVILAVIVIVIGIIVKFAGSDGGSSSNGNRASAPTASAGGVREIPRPPRKATVTLNGVTAEFRDANGSTRSVSGYWTSGGERVDLWCEASGFCTWSKRGMEFEAALTSEQNGDRVIWTGAIHHPDEGWLATVIKL